MNKKIILFSLLAGTSLFFGVDIVFADKIDKCNEMDGYWSPHWTIICYVQEIRDQNKLIIEKLDWNNCVISHKSTWGYMFETSWVKTSSSGITSYEKLTTVCGEMP